MNRRLSRGCILAVTLALPFRASGQDASAREVRPLLAKYCVSCHGKQKPKAGLNLESVRDEEAHRVWKRVWDRVKSRQMPPSDRPQPAAGERERVLSWIVGVSSIAAVCVVLVAITSVNQAAAAKAGDAPALLNDVARVYSLGVGQVRCASQLEWDTDPHRTRFSWGYTNVRGDYTVLPPMICGGAMNVGTVSVPAWQQAAGVWMLVHEAFHLRHWRFRRNEAKVGCQTIVYFTDAAARLGASDSHAQELYPYGLALHDLELDLYPWHRDPRCVVPPWFPPSAP